MPKAISSHVPVPEKVPPASYFLTTPEPSAIGVSLFWRGAFVGRPALLRVEEDLLGEDERLSWFSL